MGFLDGLLSGKYTLSNYPLLRGFEKASDVDGIAAGMNIPKRRVDTSDIEMPAPTNPDSRREPVQLSFPSPDDQLEGLSISNMLDMQKISKDFQKAKEGDPGARQRLSSPGLADSVLSMPSKDRTSEGLSAAGLPEARRVGPQEPLGAKPAGGGGVRVSDASFGEGPDTGGKMDWSMLARVLGAGLSDIAGSVGPGKLSQSPIHAMTLEDLRASQLSQLKRRQDMWDDTWKQSQALPSDILTDPRFAGLAQAKAALDKDLQDGKIDNEKNVSVFLTEMARSKKDLEELMLQTETERELEKEQMLGEGRLEQASRQRQLLEERAAAGDLEAQRILRDLKAKEMIQINYQGQDLYLPASEFYRGGMQLDELDRRAQEAEKERIWRGEQNAAELSARAADRSENRKYREAMNDQRRAQQAGAAIGSMIENSARAYAKQDEEGRILNRDEALSKAMVENEAGIVQAAQAAGVEFMPPGGPAGNVYVIQGRTFNASDPKAVSQALSLLYQLTRTDF